MKRGDAAADRRRREEVLEGRFFHVLLVLKGLDGVLEIVGGVLLLVLRPDRIDALARFLTQHELAEDPTDFVANHLLTAAHGLSHSPATMFGAVYLLSHGLLKLVLVGAVFRDRLWAYPWTIAVLGLFIGFEAYRLATAFTVGLLLLTLFDILIVWLTVRAFRRHRAALHPGRPVLGE